MLYHEYIIQRRFSRTVSIERTCKLRGGFLKNKTTFKVPSFLKGVDRKHDFNRNILTSFCVAVWRRKAPVYPLEDDTFALPGWQEALLAKCWSGRCSLPSAWDFICFIALTFHHCYLLNCQPGLRSSSQSTNPLAPRRAQWRANRQAPEAAQQTPSESPP